MGRSEELPNNRAACGRWGWTALTTFWVKDDRQDIYPEALFGDRIAIFGAPPFGRPAVRPKRLVYGTNWRRIAG